MKKILLIILCIFASFLPVFSDTEMTVEQARSLYSLLENIEGQKSLFPEEVSVQNLYNLLEEKYKTEKLIVSKDGNEMN